MTLTDDYNKASTRVRELFMAESDGQEPTLALRSKSRVDTGSWLANSPLWLFVVEDRVIVLAASKRSYCQSVSIEDCADSWYCHTTGQLVLEPAPDLKFSRLTMSPIQAVDVLAFLESTLEAKRKETPHSAKDSHAQIHS